MLATRVFKITFFEFLMKIGKGKFGTLLLLEDVLEDILTLKSWIKTKQSYFKEISFYVIKFEEIKTYQTFNGENEMPYSWT
mgnify:CR=1 FL=1